MIFYYWVQYQKTSLRIFKTNKHHHSVMELWHWGLGSVVPESDWRGLCLCRLGQPFRAVPSQRQVSCSQGPGFLLTLGIFFREVCVFSLRQQSMAISWPPGAVLPLWGTGWRVGAGGEHVPGGHPCPRVFLALVHYHSCGKSFSVCSGCQGWCSELSAGLAERRVGMQKAFFPNLLFPRD